MHYKDIIKPECIDQYKEQHRIFYSTLSSLIFDISFLEVCVELQDSELCSDWITVKFLHRNVFENLISKTYRCFFDNSGKDSITLFGYKNNVIGKFSKEEHRQAVINQVNAVPFGCDDFVSRKNALEQNLLAIRRSFVAHRLLIAEDEAVVDLREIKLLAEYGYNLFQALSFEAADFYSLGEGDGYDFSKEISFTYKSVRQFIKTSFLTSKYITRIDCQFEEGCNESVKDRIQAIIDDINENR